MAQPALETFNRRTVAILLQDVPGTAEDPDAATDAVRLYDGTSGTESDTFEDNPDSPHFNSGGVYHYNHRGFIQGNFRLEPPITPGDDTDGTPDCHLLLLPAGMTRVLDSEERTTRYNPISEAIAIATARWWQSGLTKLLYDTRHNVSGLAITIGQVPGGQVRIQGNYDALEEDALPAASYTDQARVIAQNSNSRTQITLLPGGSPLNVWGKSLSLDFGSQLQTEEYTEHKETSISGRQSTWTLRMSKTDLADFNPDTVKRAGTFLTAAIRVKYPDGRTVTLGIRGQISAVNEVDIDGKYGWELSGPCKASSAGGDEFYIEFADVSLILTGTLSDGTQDAVYSGTTGLTAEGEHGTLTWSISAGTLPTGLSIDSGTGVISGTPTVADDYTFTVQATDGVQTATSEQTVTIAAP